MSPRVMRNSNLLKWANPSSKQANKNGGSRAWIHAPDALQKGHVAYLVKYLGFTEVDEPKGIDVVKEGIRKLTFNQQLRKSEGSKIPKVELTISIDGVAIQEPKTKRIMNQYPLHRISYCADDKGEKKFFSFIAKEQDADQHVCFVFVSDKLAEEITLTIGQAFDLAYRRFLETSGKDLENHRHMVFLQQKMKRLEYENTVLRQRLHDVAQLGNKRTIEDWMSREGLSDLLAVEGEAPSTKSSTASNSEVPSMMSADFSSDLSSCTSSFMGTYGNGTSPPPVPPRAVAPLISSSSVQKPTQNDFFGDDTQPSVGTKLQGLLLDELEDDFNPRAFEANSNVNSTSTGSAFFNASSPMKTEIAPRPRPHASTTPNTNGHGDGLLGLAPGTAVFPGKKVKNHSTDLFGMEAFSSSASTPISPGFELENALGFLDKRILEMKDGFSRGLTVGNEDFSLESLDPLRN